VLSSSSCQLESTVPFFTPRAVIRYVPRFDLRPRLPLPLRSSLTVSPSTAAESLASSLFSWFSARGPLKEKRLPPARGEKKINVRYPKEGRGPSRKRDGRGLPTDPFQKSGHDLALAHKLSWRLFFLPPPLFRGGKISFSSAPFTRPSSPSW